MNHEEVRRLYEEQGPAFLGYACALLGARASAQDVLHTVFLKLMNEKETISDPVPYVYRALRKRPQCPARIQKSAGQVQLRDED
jgi:DNA-directed RNA polymerase specialized sigma24 family protein